MMKEEKNQEKQYTDRERLEMELAAIETLQQVGVSVKIPLRRHDFIRRGWKTMFREKVQQKPNISLLPGDIDVVSSLLPDPKDPQKNIEVKVADVRIRPLFVDTIDSLRARFLQIALKEEDFNKLIEHHDNRLLQYEDDMCDIMAIATVNEGSKAKKSDIKEWSKFYKSHLTNARLFHLVHIITAMYDTGSFHASIRLVAEIGTTAPRSMERIENITSKA